MFTSGTEERRNEKVKLFDKIPKGVKVVVTYEWEE